MAFYENIKTAISRIRTAISGLEVRDSIADAIEGINEKTEDINKGWKALLNAWLEIRDSDNLSFTEVIEARTDQNNVVHESLKARIDSLVEDEDKTYTTTHTYNKNGKTTSINGEGITSGTNTITPDGIVVNKLTVTELVYNGSTGETEDSGGSTSVVGIEDSGWVELANYITSGITNSSTNKSRIRKINNIVYFDLRIMGVAEENTVVATLPDGYRPSRTMYYWGFSGTVGGYPIRFTVAPDGLVTILGTSAFTIDYSSASLIELIGSYIVKD